MFKYVYFIKKKNPFVSIMFLEIGPFELELEQSTTFNMVIHLPQLSIFLKCCIKSYRIMINIMQSDA